MSWHEGWSIAYLVLTCPGWPHCAIRFAWAGHSLPLDELQGMHLAVIITDQLTRLLLLCAEPIGPALWTREASQGRALVRRPSWRWSGSAQFQDAWAGQPVVHMDADALPYDV